MTITDFCEVTRNWFDVSRHIGEYKIENGLIDLDYGAGQYLPEPLPNQYIRIVGSVLNDGIYKNAEDEFEGFADEIFKGAIWYLAIPNAVQELVGKINSWEEQNADALNKAYQSESFGGYSYSTGGNGEGISWQTHFAKDIERWQKI